MTSSTRRTLILGPVTLVVVLLLLAALACNLSTGKQKQPGAQPTPISQGGKPAVVIQAPDDNAEVLLDTDVLIYAIATDVIGVTRVELLENGFVVGSQASPNLDAGDRQFQVLLTWRPLTVGEHTLEIVPYRSTIQGQSATLTLIVRARAADITQTPAPTLPFATPFPTQQRSHLPRAGVCRRAECACRPKPGL